MGFEEELASIAEEKEKYRTALQTNLLAQHTKPRVSQTQAILSGLLSAIPMLAGQAIAGREGSVIGAQTGLAGSQNYLTNVRTANEEESQLAAANAKLNQEELKDLRTLERQVGLEKVKDEEGDIDREAQNSFTMERDRLLEDGRNRRSQNYGDALSSGKDKDRDVAMKNSDVEAITPKLQVARVADQAIRDIQSALPNNLTEAYLTKDGNIDTAGLADVATRKAKEWAFGADTQEGIAAASLQNVLREVIKQTSGTAASDTEVQRLVKIVEGGGWLPSTIPAQLALLSKLRDNTIELAGSEIEARRNFRSSSDHRAYLESVKSEFTPLYKANKVATPKRATRAQLQQKYGTVTEDLVRELADEHGIEVID